MSNLFFEQTPRFNTGHTLLAMNAIRSMAIHRPYLKGNHLELIIWSSSLGSAHNLTCWAYVTANAISLKSFKSVTENNHKQNQLRSLCVFCNNDTAHAFVKSIGPPFSFNKAGLLCIRMPCPAAHTMRELTTPPANRRRRTYSQTLLSTSPSSSGRPRGFKGSAATVVAGVGESLNFDNHTNAILAGVAMR